MPDDLASTEAAPEVDFTLDIAGVDHAPVVASLHGVEALSQPYEFALELAFAVEGAPPAGALLGRRATLTLARGAYERKVHGTLVSVEDRGVSADQRLHDVLLVPSLWLLGQRSNHRVFQGLDSVAIATAVAHDAGMYGGEGPAVMLPKGPPPPREYCVQLGEPDLAFVTRILAEDGLTFAFGEGDEGETWIILDAADLAPLPAVETMDGRPVVVMGQGGATAQAETLRTLTGVVSVRPDGWSASDWDFTHPGAPLRASHLRGREGRVLRPYPADLVLGRYDGEKYGAPDARSLAMRRAEEAAVGERMVRAVGAVLRTAPGHVLRLTDPGEQAQRALDGRHLVTRVVHTGHAPERVLGGAEGREAGDRYANHFDALPEGAVYRPAVPPKPRAPYPQSAVVVTEPEGGEEEIATDSHGRIRVRFHWCDAAQERPTGARQASCWLRVQQPWAGPEWGFLFIPRVGMEVMVQFLDGDPDRPVVTGCLYHGEHAPPVALPAHRTQSVLRTRSSPSREEPDGHNELRFEDLAKHEEVYLRAQRDLKEYVRRDHGRRVDRDEHSHIGRDSAAQVGRDRSLAVGGAETHTVDQNRTRETGGNDLTQVAGNRSVVVHRANSEHANETHRFTADEGAMVEVGGGSGTSVQMIPDEMAVVVPKQLGVTVGDDGMRLVGDPDNVVWEVPKKFTLKVGDTTVEVTTDKITLKTGGGAKVVLDGDKITLSTGGDVEVKGAQVKVNG